MLLLDYLLIIFTIFHYKEIPKFSPSFWAPKSLQMVTEAMKLKDAYSLEGKTNLDGILKSRDITLPTKVHLVEAMVFP